MFRPTSILSGGLLWKIPWRLSAPQKYRQRQRLKRVDSVIATVASALGKKNQTLKNLERWKQDMPTEGEMLARDKYTVYSRYSKGYRKTVRKMPKWTRISQRLNPPGF